MKERIAIFGGTFNPPHYGHLWILQQIYELKRYDTIIMLPTYSGNACNKLDALPVQTRYDLCKLTLKDFGNNNLHLSSMDIERHFEYTYQTVQYIDGLHKYDCTFFVGDDWKPEQFKNYDKIKHLVNFVSINRNGPGTLAFPISYRLSSSIIRERIKNGLSISGLVTPSVETYIKENKLYE